MAVYAWGRPRIGQAKPQPIYAWGRPRIGGPPPSSTVTAVGGWKPGGFEPFKAPDQVPPGSYDPSLDAQLENAQKGFFYGTQDYDTAVTRGTNDYNTALAGLDLGHNRTNEDLATSLSQALQDYGLSNKYTLADLGTNRDRGLQDLGLNKSRSLADLLRSHNWAQEDFGTQRGDIRRNYVNLADSQGGALESSGVASGGALAQALAKRTENQGREIGLVDTQAGREGTLYKTNTGRVNEDYKIGSGRLKDDYSTGVGRANEQYGLQTSRAQSGYDTALGRSNQDYGVNSSALSTNWARTKYDMDTAQQRAQEQLGMFTNQTTAMKTAQATAAGRLPTGPVDAAGNPLEHIAQSGPNAGKSYRTITHNGTIYHQYSDGRLVPIRKA